MAEEAVLDFVPLGCSRRIVAHRDREAGLVSKLLQCNLPEPDACTVRAAAVGRDHELACVRIARAPHLGGPASDRFNCELCPVVGDAGADPTAIFRPIAHTPPP